jgi:hypothetical protein
MTELRPFLFVAFASFAAASAGCTGTAGRVTAPQTIRILSSEAASVQQPEAAACDAAPTSDATATRPGARIGAPRIGAPGGSGAGSRRVVPAQSGNEAVGGLPAGAGTGAGVAGRG